MSWSRALSGVALVVTVVGLSALALQVMDAGSAGRMPTLQAWWADATRQPLLGWLATIWATATVAAWTLDRWGWSLSARPKAPRQHGAAQKLSTADKPSLEAPRPSLTGEQPTAREDDVRRLKLEAFLRGRPNAAAFVSHLLDTAQNAGASDIHLQVSNSNGLVTFRIGGELRTMARYDRDRHDDVVRRLKVMAGLPPYVTDKPQDGSFADGDLDIRLSSVPSRDGERIALRLAGDASLRPLEDLGFEAVDLRRWRRLLTSPQGLIVLTGPTGSGKTTTLYSALHHVHQERGDRIAISSIEDPIEVALPFIHQVAVDRARGVAFAKALRAVLRQDPNVLMIGEIRDSETARVAVQAGLSGHLILTTLHAESALGIFPRLIDLGTEPFLAASATVAAVAQRLVPRLCPACRHPRTLDRATTDRVRQRFGADVLDSFGGESHIAPGCERCRRQGFEGRQAIFEIIEIDPALRRLIAAKASHEDLQRAIAAAHPAAEDRPPSLAESAIRLATRGEITLEYALSVDPHFMATGA